MPVGRITPESVIEQAKRMLAEGHSRNHVQVTLDLAKTTVARIENGTYLRSVNTRRGTLCQKHRCVVVDKLTGDCHACRAERQAALTLASQRAILGS